MNKIILIGRLTHTPELKSTNEGKSVVKFSIAVTRRFNREKTDFINCEAWNGTAEFIAKYFPKGKEIAVVGELHIDKKEANGEIKSYTTVVVDEAYFSGSGNKSEEKAEAPAETKPEPEIDDDLPF